MLPLMQASTFGMKHARERLICRSAVAIVAAVLFLLCLHEEFI
jgi:hypothetical protein